MAWRWELKLAAILLVGAMALVADPQQPFDPTTLGFHIGYLNGRVAPEVDLGIKMGAPVAGFQAYSVTGFAVQAVRSHPTSLEATAVTGVAMVRPLGEYVYYGPLVQGGVGNDGKNTAAVGKADFVAGYRFGHSQHWSAELVAGATRSPIGTYIPEAVLGVRYGFNAGGLAPGPITQARAPKPKKAKMRKIYVPVTQ